MKIHQLMMVAGLIGALPAAASTLTFQQGVDGYFGTQDTMIRSNETAMGSGQTVNGDSRGLNFGGLDYVSVDGDDGSPGNKPNQGLIRFDDLFGNASGQIKATDTILSATLTLQVYNPGSGMTVHDMLIGWNQNTVTWNSVANGIQANGSEAAATALATFGANNGSENIGNGTLTINVTSSLQAFQAGTLPGFGWVLIPFASGTNGIDFYSGEYSELALRPMLQIEVAAVPEPETYAMFLAGLGLMGLVARRRTAR